MPPYTVEEIVCEAKSAYDAGAAIVHLHLRRDDGTPTQDRERFRECIDAIYKMIPDVILIPSTGGAVGMSAEERLQPTELMPEMGRAGAMVRTHRKPAFASCLVLLSARGLGVGLASQFVAL